MKNLKLIFLFLLFILTFQSGLYAQNYGWKWAHKIGIEDTSNTSNSFWVNDMQIDDTGNIYQTGYYYGKPFFQDGNNKVYFPLSKGKDDIFCTKLDKNGKLKWLITFGTNYGDYGEKLTLSPKGDILIGGSFNKNGNKYDTLDFGNNFKISSLGGDGVFILCLQNSGKVLWSKSGSGAKNFALIKALNIDQKGNYALGCYFGNYSKNNLPDTFFIGNRKIYSKNTFYSLVLDSSGNINSLISYIHGLHDDDIMCFSKNNKNAYFLSDTIDYNSWTYNSFVTAYSTSGGFIWQKNFENVHIDLSFLNSDVQGNISFNGIGDVRFFKIDTITINCGNGLYSCSFIANFDSAGHIKWAFNPDSSGKLFLRNCSYNIDSSIYFTGEYMDTGYIYKSYIQGHGKKDLILINYNNKGQLNWIKNAGSKTDDAAYLIAQNSKSQSIVLSGRSTHNTLDTAYFGPYKVPLESKYYTEFLTKLSTCNLLSPVITVHKDTLYSNYTYGNQWYINDSAIKGANAPYFITTKPGRYSVIFTDSAGCFSSSQQVNIKKFASDAGISTIINPKTNICEGLTNLSVRLYNYGLDTLKSVRINYKIIPQDTIITKYNWQGKLSPGNSILISLGNIVLHTGINSIFAWTSMPNGLKDSMSNNDSAIQITTVLDSGSAKWTASVKNASVSFSPANTKANLYRWNFGDSLSIKNGNDTSSRQNPTHLYLANGNYKIKLVETAKNGCNSEFDSTLSILITGVQNLNDENQYFNIYPNPFRNSISISLKEPVQSKLEICIYSITGQLIYCKNFTGSLGSTLELDGSGLTNGAYLLKITTEQISQIIKIEKE